MVYTLFRVYSLNCFWRSADQLSRFRLNSQGIDHSVKGENEKYGNVKEKSQERCNCDRIKIIVH